LLGHVRRVARTSSDGLGEHRSPGRQRPGARICRCKRRSCRHGDRCSLLPAGPSNGATSAVATDPARAPYRMVKTANSYRCISDTTPRRLTTPDGHNLCAPAQSPVDRGLVHADRDDISKASCDARRHPAARRDPSHSQPRTQRPQWRREEWPEPLGLCRRARRSTAPMAIVPSATARWH
jgi:hypothetical protein